MRRCEDGKMFYRPPLLEEPCAQTLSGKTYSSLYIRTSVKCIYISIIYIYIYTYNHSPREVCHYASRQRKCAAPVVKTQPSPLTQSREKKDYNVLENL